MKKNYKKVKKSGQTVQAFLLFKGNKAIKWKKLYGMKIKKGVR